MVKVSFSSLIQTDEVVLFPFDNYSIPFRNGLQLNLVEGTKYHGNPIIRPGEPGRPDSKYVAYYGTVIRVNTEFWMWYIGLGDRDNNRRVCLAISKDGIDWTKPHLGLVEYNGDRKNNIVELECMEGGVRACVVIYDPEDQNLDKRFKMSYEGPYEEDKRSYVAYSRDGLIWKNSPNNPVIRPPLEQSGLTKFNGCYYVVGQGGGFRSIDGSIDRRCLVTHASYDFEHWTEAVVLGFRRDNVPPRPLVYGRQTGEQVHLGAALWNRGNVIIGFYGMWHGPPPVVDDRRYVTMDIGLVVSNDAIHYREPIPDFRIIPIGGFEERDCSAPIPFQAYHAKPRLMQGQGFENVGDRTYVWYSAWTEGMVRLATWPRDRFGYYAVSNCPTEGQKPSEDLGPHFISCPIQLDHKESYVYVNVGGLSENSFLTVEVLNREFCRLPGFSGDDCIKLTESGFRQHVIWRNKKRLPKFETPIRIQVNYDGLRVEDARIYAVYISNPPL